MKDGTPTCPKMLKLARVLRVPRYAAVGLMETLWHYTAEFVPAGDIGRLDDQDIATALGWDPDDAARLVGALVESRWLDEHPAHRLVVHAWAEHCESGVHRTLAKRVELFADGSLPSLSKLEEKDRERTIRAYKAKFGEAVGQPRNAASAPPAPTQAGADIVDVAPNGASGRPAAPVGNFGRQRAPESALPPPSPLPSPPPSPGAGGPTPAPAPPREPAPAREAGAAGEPGIAKPTEALPLEEPTPEMLEHAWSLSTAATAACEFEVAAALQLAAWRPRRLERDGAGGATPAGDELLVVEVPSPFAVTLADANRETMQALAEAMGVHLRRPGLRLRLVVADAGRRRGARGGKGAGAAKGQNGRARAPARGARPPRRAANAAAAITTTTQPEDTRP